MLKWFKNCKTIEDAKELYKKLCREYHPDLNENDTTETMKSINNEFETVFKILKNKHRADNTDTTADSRENETTTETPAEFMSIINSLISCEGLTIELVGRWIWVSGNTYIQGHYKRTWLQIRKQEKGVVLAYRRGRLQEP